MIPLKRTSFTVVVSSLLVRTLTSMVTPDRNLCLNWVISRTIVSMISVTTTPFGVVHSGPGMSGVRCMLGGILFVVIRVLS